MKTPKTANELAALIMEVVKTSDESVDVSGVQRREIKIELTEYNHAMHGRVQTFTVWHPVKAVFVSFCLSETIPQHDVDRAVAECFAKIAEAARHPEKVT